MTKRLVFTLFVFSLFAAERASAVTLSTLIVTTDSEADTSNFPTEDYQVGNWGTIDGGGSVTPGTDNHFQNTGAVFDGTSPLGPLMTYGEYDLVPTASTSGSGGLYILSGTLQFGVTDIIGENYDIVVGAYTGASANGTIESNADNNGGPTDFTAGSAFSIIGAGTATGSSPADFAAALPSGLITAMNSATNGYVGIQFSAAAGTRAIIGKHSADVDGASIGARLLLASTFRPVAVATAGASDTTFNFNDLTLELSGATSTDADGTVVSYTWTAGTNAAANNLTLAQSGITQPGGSATIGLSVVDNDGAPNSSADANDSLLVTYQNVAPAISDFSVTPTGGNTYDLSLDLADSDFAANAAWNSNGFELVDLALFDDDTNAFIQNLQLNINAALNNAVFNVNLLPGNYFVRATDNGLNLAALLDEEAFTIVAAAVPEPASVAIWSLVGLSLVAFGLRRYRRK